LTKPFDFIRHFESPLLLDFQFSQQHIQENLVVFYAQQSKNKFFLCVRLTKTFQASLSSVRIA